MKKTVWEIDAQTNLNYDHSSEEIWISQDTRVGSGAKTNEILLAKDDLSPMMFAMGELKALLESEIILKLEDAAA